LAGLSRVRTKSGHGCRAAVAAAFIAAWAAPNSTESAVANGDTRTVSFSNQHTSESGSFTYMVNGVYDQGVLDKLNWFMRDWRLNEPTKMDPRLFDIIWEVYRESGSRRPVNVFSAYRSPQTNAMLRRRSRQVAEHSQHMEGKAIDAHFEDVGPGRIRDIAMRMQEGGVGFYPQGLTWVHIDSGSVRYWPRMSRDSLARLFPDGKTVFIPADGQPMSGYEQARAELEARGEQIQTAGGGGLFAWLFGSRGGGADDAEESGGQEAVTASRSGNGRGGGGGRFAEPTVEVAEAGPEAVATAKRHLPTGPTYASPAPEPAPVVAAAPAPAPAPAPAAAPEPAAQVVAALEQPKVESDAQPDAAPEAPVKFHGALAAIYLAPMPPRRPSDFEIASLANFPLPPVRPVEFAAQSSPALPPARPASLASAGAPETTASIVPLPPARPEMLVLASAPEASAAGAKTVSALPASPLPKAITQGLTSIPRGSALALAEMPPASKDDDSALLARAAELTAPLPLAPIPNAGASSTLTAVAPERGHGGVVANISKLFGSLSFEAFKTTKASQKPDDLRGIQ
jgi:uncharacterized protein YcbK (DUF882 family)